MGTRHFACFLSRSSAEHGLPQRRMVRQRHDALSATNGTGNAVTRRRAPRPQRVCPTRSQPQGLSTLDTGQANRCDRFPLIRAWTLKWPAKYLKHAGVTGQHRTGRAQPPEPRNEGPRRRNLNLAPLEGWQRPAAADLFFVASRIVRPIRWDRAWLRPPHY